MLILSFIVLTAFVYEYGYTRLYTICFILATPL